MLRVRDLAAESVAGLIRKFGMSIELLADGQPIKGSFWGDPEAGIVGKRVFVRGDTPVHSLLHETAHVVCMTPERRSSLDGNAGGDDLEECAVCFLQIVLADELAGVGKERLMRDMDDWGYSFRFGNSKRWFEEDAGDAEEWLLRHGLLRDNRRPTFRLRGTWRQTTLP
jgi:hypothetical protein